MTTVTIYEKLPSLNEYVRECRTNPYQAAKYKRETESMVSIYLARLPVFKNPIVIHFTWVEENHRRDLDNICGGGRKFILDSMVKLGKIPDDSHRYIKGFTDKFVYAKKAKVILEIEEVNE